VLTSGVIDDFLRVLAALLIVLDPLGPMPVIVSISANLSPRETRGLIYKVVGGATILLLFFTVTGTYVLAFFGVTIDHLRIGGGLLLLLIALRLVMEGRLSHSREEEYKAAVVPLISPLLVGPGSITAAVVLARIHGVGLTALAGLAAMLITLALFLTSKLIHRLIGSSGADLVSRVMGVMIAAIAVSYISAGVLGSLRSARVL